MQFAEPYHEYWERVTRELADEQARPTAIQAEARRLVRRFERFRTRVKLHRAGILVKHADEAQ